MRWYQVIYSYVFNFGAFFHCNLFPEYIARATDVHKYSSACIYQLGFYILLAANKCSLEIDYKQFIYIHPNIAIWLADAPQSVLEVMEDVGKNIVFDLHPNYRNIHQKIYVRITNLPVYDQIRNIR